MTITKPIKQPRAIRPEIVEVGDDISVELKPSAGVRMSKRGIIGSTYWHGKTKYFATAEGAVLFTFEPGRSIGYTLILYGRAEYVSETLFGEDSMPEVKERIAS